MFTQVFKSRHLKNALQTISMTQHHCFLTSIKLDILNMFTRIITKSFALMYRKIEIRFDIYGTEYSKSVIKGFKFVFSNFFSL